MSLNSNKSLSYDEVKYYLDSAIGAWREIKKDKEDPNHKIADYYIDAYQSVRVSILGRLLPPDSSAEDTCPQCGSTGFRYVCDHCGFYF